MSQDYPIGFFDSGSGGLSVLAAFRQVMPQENCVYFGDHANLPYGLKPANEIRALTIKGCDALAAQNIKALVVACNTASTAALDVLQNRYPFPVLGIEPPLAEALQLSEGGSILVMATPATIKSARYKALAAPHRGRFLHLPCPGLAETVEAEDQAEQAALLAKLFSSLDKSDISAIALGCTHYPLIKDAIAAAFGTPVPILDGYALAAAALRDALNDAGLLNSNPQSGQVALSTSGGEGIKTRLWRILDRHTSLISSDYHHFS